jgi:hypothetical protein
VREQGVRFGHNVFVYHNGEPGTLTVELGVEVFGELHRRLRDTDRANAAGRSDNRHVLRRRLFDPAKDPAQTRTDIYFLLEPE